MTAVIPVIGPACLIAVHPVVRRIEIQDQLLRRLGKGLDEQLQQYLVDRHHPGTLCPGLEPAQGRGAGQHPVLPDRRLQGRIVAQLVVIVQVLVAQTQGIQPLTQQMQLAVLATGLPTGIAKQPGYPGCQTEPAVLFAHQHHPAIAGDFSAVEIGLDFTALAV